MNSYQSSFGQIYGELMPIDNSICPRVAIRYHIGIGTACPTDGLHVGTTSTFDAFARFNTPARFNIIEIGEFSNLTGNTIPAF